MNNPKSKDAMKMQMFEVQSGDDGIEGRAQPSILGFGWLEQYIYIYILLCLSHPNQAGVRKLDSPSNYTRTAQSYLKNKNGKKLNIPQRAGGNRGPGLIVLDQAGGRLGSATSGPTWPHRKNIYMAIIS